jgi:pyruvate/2-oxoglutarate dehydrogenase complex dihydrolipoamide acyltransferase (E2) component
MMKTTGNGTEDTMAEMKAPAGQPVVVTQIAPAKMTLAEVHAKLDGKTGRRFWKNLDELADTPAFHELMREESMR